MKALISPNEAFDLVYVSSWVRDGEKWEPVYSEVPGCQRVAEVEPDTNVFEVAPPLYWVDCPDDCSADAWYFKDGVHKKPENAQKPE